MTTHEERLLAVLEKIGQTEEVSASVASITDADAPLGEHLEGRPTVSGDPNEPPAKVDIGIPETALTPVTRKNLFVHHDTHPVVLDIILLQQYEEQWFLWEAETLWKEIKEDFRVPSISDHSKAKIQAVKTLHINEWYWTKWEVFCWITQALNNNIPDFQVLQKPSIPQLFNSVDIASLVRNDEVLSAEAQMFSAAAVVDEGVFYAPEPIEFCQDEIIQLLEEFKIDDFKDTISAVKARYEEVSKLSPQEWIASGEPILKETPVDVQVAKLKVASDYLQLRRKQLKAQLRLLQ